MAEFDFKTATPDTSVTDAQFYFGADSQSDASPKIYQNVALRTLLLGTSTSTAAIAAGKTLTVSNSGTLAGGDAFILAIAAGKTATISNTLTFTGTDSTSFAFPSTSDTVVGLAATQTLTNKTLTAPTLTTPALGAATGTSVSVTGALASRSGTATPAAASAVSGLAMGSAAVGVYWGTGSPNTALSAAKGSLYLRTDGAGVADRAYINTDGSSAWTNLVTAG